MNPCVLPDGTVLRERAGSPLKAKLAEQRINLSADLRAARDAAAERLAAAVAALENIRLDLLRLKAGAGTVDELTSDLSAARRIGEEIDATLAGPEETEALLKEAASHGT